MIQNIRIFLLTSLFGLGLIAPACNFNPETDCNCDGIPEFFDVLGISSITNVSREDASSIPIDTSVVIPWTDLVLLLSLEAGPPRATYNSPEEPKLAPFSLIPAAYACTCLPPGWNGSPELVNELTIRTLNDFDADHLAGSVINDIIQIQVLGGTASLDERDLDSYLLQNSLRVEGQVFRFTLEKSPEIDSNFQVSITLRIQDLAEETYRAESIPIRLN